MAARTDDWRTAIAVGLAAAAAPIVTVMGLGAIFEPESPKILGLILLPALALLAWLVLRQRRALATVVGGGVLGGWVLGIGIRVAMFVAAEMGGGVERSVGGTAGLILFFAFPGIALSGLLLAVRGIRERDHVAKGLLAALICAALIAGPVRDELVARGHGGVNAVLFLAAAALAGVTIGAVQARIDAWWEGRIRRANDVRQMA